LTRLTLAEILSGTRDRVNPSDLQAGLTALLDEAEKNNGNLDPVRFWTLVAQLAQGRGIAEALEHDAANMLAEKTIADKNPASIWVRFQWAMLFKLMQKLDAFKEDLLPRDFSVAAFLGASLNFVEGGRRHVDLLGVGSSRASQQASARAAKAMLVKEVFRRMARDKCSEEVALRAVMPLDGRLSAPKTQHNEGFWRTWAGKGGWRDQAAAYLGVSVEQLRLQASEEVSQLPMLPHAHPTAAQLALWWALANDPR